MNKIPTTSASLVLRYGYTLVILSILCCLEHRNINADESKTKSTAIKKIFAFYQPYLNVHTIWLEKGKSENRYEFFREKNKGKLISEQIRSSNKNATTLSRGEYLAIENQSMIRHLSQYDSNKEKVSDDLVISYLKIPDNAFLSSFASFTAGVCMGVLHGKWIPDLLKDEKAVDVQTATIEGKEFIELLRKSQEEKYSFRFFVDPSLDYSVVKIEVEMEYPKQDVSLENVTLEELPVQFVKNTYILGDFKKENGLWVPYQIISESQYSPYASISSTVDAHGKPIVSRDSQGKLILMSASAAKTTSTLEKIEFNFSFSNSHSFTFTPSIPDGTRVRMKDANHLDFMWKDGKVVPITDEAILALRGQRFIPYPNEPRFWLIAIGSAMIILSIVLKIREYRKQKAER
jgi:hypothetical protein